jgi:hypothetical protein
MYAIDVLTQRCSPIAAIASIFDLHRIAVSELLATPNCVVCCGCIVSLTFLANWKGIELETKLALVKTLQLIYVVKPNENLSLSCLRAGFLADRNRTATNFQSQV